MDEVFFGQNLLMNFLEEIYLQGNDFVTNKNRKKYCAMDFSIFRLKNVL